MTTATSILKTEQYGAIADCDPLQLDLDLAALPQMNQECNVVSIQDILGKAVVRAATIDTEDDIEAFAIIRDLDFLASSLTRHGINSVTSTPGLEGELVRLSVITNTVPRGTVYTYAAANPSGPRERTFTGTDEESIFIGAVRNSVRGLDTATTMLGRVVYADASEDAKTAMGEVQRASAHMKDSIVEVHRKVSPELFTNVLRPYFDPITIDGQKYLGAGGAQMQLLAVDHMLWGIDDDDAMYRGFFDENYPYLTPSQKESMSTFGYNNDNVSIVSFLSKSGDASTRQTAIETLREIRKFRYPHKKVADNNFKVRGPEAVGSGSFRPDILGHMIFKTELAISKLEAA